MTEKKKGRAPTDEEYQQADILSEQSRFDRMPSDDAINWALTVLHGELALAARNYKTTDLQRQRDSVVEASFAVQRFLKSRGFNEAIVEPFMRPALALIERENNRLDPLFCERVRSSRPSRSFEDHSRIGAIAALAEAWLEFHKQQDLKVPQKIERLIRQISGPWFGDLTVGRVTAARELVSREAKDHPAVTWAGLYREHIELAKNLGGMEVAIKTVARSLNRHGDR